jgi:hypothetical protein
MPSNLKSETARLNGAKSRGPKTYKPETPAEKDLVEKMVASRWQRIYDRAYRPLGELQQLRELPNEPTSVAVKWVNPEPDSPPPAPSITTVGRPLLAAAGFSRPLRTQGIHYRTSESADIVSIWRGGCNSINHPL